MTRTSFVATAFLLHRERLPSAAELRLMDAVLIASADHGSGAPSCAAARLAASGNRGSLSAAIAAGILAIGDEHGGAGEACMEMLGQCLALAKSESLSIDAAARRLVTETRRDGRRVPGLGHRVHTVDPRVRVLFAMAEELELAGDGITAARALETAAAEIIKPLPLNVDAALAAVLYDLGFPSSAGKYIFIIGRVAGLTAEVAEEHLREKPMRIRIPVEYDGVPSRPLP